MIKNFDLFINEAKSLPAKWKVGDEIICLPYQTYKSSTRGLEPSNTRCGAIVKIEEVTKKGSSWIYTCSITDGGLYENHRIYNDSWLKIKGNENQFTDEGIEKFKAIKKTAKYKVKDEVTVIEKSPVLQLSGSNPINKKQVTSVYSTSKIYSIAVDQTINYNTPCYLLESGIVISEESIEEEIDKQTIEKAIPEMAKYIAKDINVDYKEGGNPEYGGIYYSFDIKTINTGDLFDSNSKKILFATAEDKAKFIEDFEKLIETHCNKKLHKIFSLKVKVNQSIKENKLYGLPELKAIQIPDALRNMGVNIAQFIQERRGMLKMKKFGF